MELYYETQLGKLWKTDAVEFLKSLPSESVRLIVADPPYGIGKAEWDSFEDRRSYVEWSMKWIGEAARILDKQGSLYVMGFSEVLADLKWHASKLFEGCKWLVWYYRNKGNLGKGWGRSHESILHLRKTKKYLFDTDPVRVPYNQHTLRYPIRGQAKTSQYGNGKEYIWKPHPLGAKPRDVFEIPTLCNGTAEKTDHPTQKPLALVRKFVLSSSNTGDLIVDPFGGSGTTYVACEESDRLWIGCEKEEEFCKLIKDRLSHPDHYRGEQTDPESETAVRKRRLELRHGRNTAQ